MIQRTPAASTPDRTRSPSGVGCCSGVEVGWEGILTACVQDCEGDERESEDGHQDRPDAREQSCGCSDDDERDRQARASGRSEHALQHQDAAAPERGQPEEEGQRLIETGDELRDSQERKPPPTIAPRMRVRSPAVCALGTSGDIHTWVAKGRMDDYGDYTV